jgi:hypothetical protein
MQAEVVEVEELLVMPATSGQGELGPAELPLWLDVQAKIDAARGESCASPACHRD